MKKNSRKALSVFLTLLIILSIAPTNIVTKASATDERIQWSFDGETVTISGTGELSEEYTTTDEWKNMQDKCVNVIVEGEIEIIGDNAFKDFTVIKNVEVTSSSEKIGKYAFSDCTSLESITLPDTVTVIDEYAFSGCKALKNFQFPKNLIKINQWAFKGCECFDNKQLVLPDTLQKVGLGAFSGANITSLTSPFVGIGIIKNEDSKNSNSIGHMFGNESFTKTYICRDGVYADYYYMPNSLKEVTITKHIYDNNFEYTKIEKIVLKDTVETTCITYKFANKSQELKEVIIENPVKITKIGNSAFDCCYALEGITIPKNVTEIGYRAFAFCRFTSIEIPDKVEIISDYAFFKCTGITSIVIPDSVKSIGEYVFKGCSNLENVKMPSTYYTIGEGVFDETKYTGTEDDFVITEDGVLTKYRGTDTEIVVPEGVTQIGTTFSGNTTVTSIILPNSLLYIEENAFSGCSALSKIVLPESLEYISENSFSGCSSLTEINLPDGLLTIPENAFKGCSSLPELTIPDTVLEIKPAAFYGCCKIKELVIPDSVVKIERRAFAGMCGLEKLTVPFIGQGRNVETNSYYAIIGYWFDSDQDDLHGSLCDYCRGYFNRVNQTYVSASGYKGAHNIWKPSNFKELTVNGGTLRSYALKEFNLEILNIGENVEAIEEYAADNLGLTELNFHEDAKFTEIPYRAFSNNSFTSITIPKNVKKIGEAFTTYGGYTNVLSEINLNEGLEVIEGSFVNAKITSIDLPDSLIEIGTRSFTCCQRLEYIEFPENLTEIGVSAFKWAGLKEIVFSENITWISGGAFNRCPVQKIVIPESLADLAEEIFKECEELEIVVIGGNVEKIGPMAFADCPTLETVVIPDSVTTISEDAFENANENLVIYCNEGSYAQTYATENNIKYTTLVIDPIGNQTYTGQEIKPEVKASANNRRLTMDSEYTVSYKDNINAGSAKAIVKGLGDFKHLVATAKFTILPQGIDNIRVIGDNVTYSPGGVEPKIYVFNGIQKLVEGQDYELLNNTVLTAAGEYNIAVSLVGNYDGVINLTYKVERRSIRQTEIMFGDTVKVVYKGVQLEEGKDFTVTKETKENGCVVTTVEGIGNYEGSFTHTEDNENNSESQISVNWLARFFDLIKQLFERLFSIGV